MRVRIRRHSGGNGRLLLLAGMVGLLAGGLGILFHLAVDGLLRWPALVVGRSTWPGPLRWVLLLLGILLLIRLSRWIVRRMAPETAGSGIPQIEGTLEDQMPLRWRRVLPAKLLGGIAALGAGLVLGREGPTMHMGGAAGTLVGETGRCGHEDVRTLVAAGAAAGLAAAFNAPLAAVLFTIEETRRQVPYAFGRYHAIILAACIAAFLTERVGGVGPELDLAQAADVPLAAYLLFPLLGAVIGAFGVLFNSGLVAALGVVGRSSERRRLLIEAALAGLLAAAFMVLPALTGGGETLVADLTAGDPGVALLLVLLVLRTAANSGLLCDRHTGRHLRADAGAGHHRRPAVRPSGRVGPARRAGSGRFVRHRRHGRAVRGYGAGPAGRRGARARTHRCLRVAATGTAHLSRGQPHGRASGRAADLRDAARARARIRSGQGPPSYLLKLVAGLPGLAARTSSPAPRSRQLRHVPRRAPGIGAPKPITRGGSAGCNRPAIEALHGLAPKPLRG